MVHFQHIFVKGFLIMIAIGWEPQVVRVKIINCNTLEDFSIKCRVTPTRNKRGIWLYHYRKPLATHLALNPIWLYYARVYRYNFVKIGTPFTVLSIWWPIWSDRCPSFHRLPTLRLRTHKTWISPNDRTRQLVACHTFRAYVFIGTCGHSVVYFHVTHGRLRELLAHWNVYPTITRWIFCPSSIKESHAA